MHTRVSPLLQVLMAGTAMLQLPLHEQGNLDFEDPTSWEAYEVTLPALVLVGGPGLAVGEMVTALEFKVCRTVIEFLLLPSFLK
jgi:hypothetical protein